MSASAARRRAARKKNPFANAIPGVLKRPEGCPERCPECLTRCLCCCSPEYCETDHEHEFACDH